MLNDTVNVFTAEEFETYFQPLVYYVTKGNKILYIGSSGKGFIRVLTQDGIDKRTKAFNQADKIHVLLFKTEKEARAFERAEIIRRKPKYNGDPDYKPYS